MPVAPGEPPWRSDDRLINRLVSEGYAVAGSANTMFWPLELAFADQPALLAAAESVLGPPRWIIAMGFSIGGTISAGRVQRFGDLMSGALAMCANLAGAVATHNRELDIAFVVKTLLAPDSPLRLVGITDPHANLQRALAVLHDAQGCATGRARLALAAAVGNIPGWHDPITAEPAPDDFDARQRNQFAWFEEVCFLVYCAARAQVEQQAGGNPSWNAGVDYDQLLATSINRDQVEALYRLASLDLDSDLARLADEPRIDADPSAVDYLERHIVFTGDLAGVPVLSMHTDGDGLVTPDHTTAYAGVVHHAGNDELFRPLFIHRGGHCTFTLAEVLTSLNVLVERIELGTWPYFDPRSLNRATAALGAETNRLPSGKPSQPGYCVFDPPPFTRPYDVRDQSATRRFQ